MDMDSDVFQVIKPFRAGDFFLKKGDPYIPTGAVHVEKLIEQRYLARVYDAKLREDLRKKLDQVERVPAAPPRIVPPKSPEKAKEPAKSR